MSPFFLPKVGPISEMISSYEAALKVFEEADSANEAAVSLRYEKVCRVTYVHLLFPNVYFKVY